MNPNEEGNMVRSIHELRKTSDEELIAEHDARALHTMVGTDYFVQELDRRSRERSAAASMELARQSAEIASMMNARVGELVIAMSDQLRLAKEARADSERSERFTRMMSWSSLAVSIVSLGAAVAAIIVSVAFGSA